MGIHEGSPNLEEQKAEDDARALVDLEMSRNFDTRRASSTYRALLWACATGLVKGVIGASPCRDRADEQLVAKQLWLTTLAKAATSSRTLCCSREGRFWTTDGCRPESLGWVEED